jgi:molybdate transport system ATP-binding protein
MKTTVLSMLNITVRNMDRIIFNDLSFNINSGEQWALVGESGSGKSALLQTIAGKLNITRGAINHHYYDDLIATHPIVDPYFTHHKLIAVVSSKYGFRNLSNTTDLYYQQRFNSSDSEDSLTVQQCLDNVQPPSHGRQVWSPAQIIDDFNLGPLLSKQLIKLSNGETKRLLLAAALLKQPKLLLLDNPLTGLDVQTRASFNVILNGIAESGISMVLATSPYEIPQAATHVAILRQGVIVSRMPKADFDPALVKVAEIRKIDLNELTALLSINRPTICQDMVRMCNVTIRYGEKIILDHVSWQIQQGDHWALVGPNGAGKSTLLSLINGDNPQAYANDITLFDRKRGTGESIWDIKSKIGFVSPELHQYFPTDNDCLQVIESGFYDTLGLFQRSHQVKADLALRWMKLLELEQYASKPFKNVPASIQRLVLLARALVKNPSLLIFDEPCQGLDLHQQNHFKNIVDAICQISNVTLIYVTHYYQEIPVSVNKMLELENGKVV